MYSRHLPSADIGDLRDFRERIRALTAQQQAQRARKAQWLPDEVDDDIPVYLDPLRTQQNAERIRKECEARAMAMQVEAERAQKSHMEAVERAEQLRMRQQHERNASTAGRNYSEGRNPSIPIPAQRPSSARSQSPIPKPKSHLPPKPLYTEKHETAASAIQQQFRIHRSLRTVANIASEFQALKSAFVYPTVIDFQELGPEEGYISVSTTRAPSDFDEITDSEVEEDGGETQMEVDGRQPKLAYTALNYSIHSYVDKMEKLLMKLDGVESWGDKGVRESRRSVAREIGDESARLERYWKQAWTDYIEKQKEGVHKEEPKEVEVDSLSEEMEIEEEPVHVELPKVEDNDEWLDVAVPW